MAVMIENGFDLPQANHARIGYRDVIASVTASSADAGAPASSVLSWQTYERWRPTASPATLTATFPAATIDYIGIGAHRLSRATSVTFEIQVAGAWSEIVPGVIEGVEAADNEPIMLLMTPREDVTGVRVSFSYTGDAPDVGKMVAGQVLTMQRPFYAGHSPAMLARNTSKQPNISEGGEWLGSTIIRQGRSTQVTWEHLRAPWYRAYFDPFVEHARRYPFFFAWNPRRFPDCLYAMTTEDAIPDNMGKRDFMIVTLGMKGYSDGTQPNLNLYPPLWDETYIQATANADIIDIAVNQEWPAA